MRGSLAHKRHTVADVITKGLFVICLALLPSRAMAETVQQFIAGFVQDFDNLDWPRFRARFSDDSTVFFPPAYGAARATGRAETDPAWLRTFESIRAASGVSAPPYMQLQPRDLLVQDWPGGAVVTFTLGGGAAPLNRRTLVLRPEGDSFVIVHLHGSTLLPAK
jgi:hypothetical protein